METAEIIDPGFSVADAENVSISTTRNGLEVVFTDWTEKMIKILFVDAISHRWDRIDWNFLEGERFDSTHIIHDSEWLREHLAQRSVEEGENYKHYRLNFNAEGSLQVIARDLEIKAEQISDGNAGKPHGVERES